MEETESNLEAFVEAHPELFDCDVFVICDMGNLRVGEPALTTALRGDVACVVTVSTLEHPLHSGVFGGAAPDAMMALARLLATLHDDAGDVAVAGVSRPARGRARTSSEDDFRASADLLDGVELTGTGTIGSRLWAKPSINAIGLDMTSIAGSSNVLIPAGEREGLDADRARRRPRARARRARRATSRPTRRGVRRSRCSARRRRRRSLRDRRPGLRRRARRAGARRSARPWRGRAAAAPSRCCARCESVAPRAEFILWGPEDVAASRIHASDESVDPSEIEKLVVAQALLLQKLAERA